MPVVAGVAQLVEQRIRNAKVEGSTPFTGTNEIKHLAQPARLGFVASGVHVATMQPHWLYFDQSSYDVQVEGVEGALCALYYEGTLYGSAYTGYRFAIALAGAPNFPTKMEVLHAVVQAELGNEQSEYKPTVNDEPIDVYITTTTIEEQEEKIYSMAQDIKDCILYSGEKVNMMFELINQN